MSGFGKKSPVENRNANVGGSEESQGVIICFAKSMKVCLQYPVTLKHKCLRVSWNPESIAAKLTRTQMKQTLITVPQMGHKE